MGRVLRTCCAVVLLRTHCMYSLVAYYGAIERSAAGSAEAVVKSGHRLRAVGSCSRTAVQRAGDRRPSLQQLPPRSTPVSTRHERVGQRL